MTANVHTFRTASDPPVRHLVLSSIQQALGTPWGGGQTLPLVTGQTMFWPDNFRFLLSVSSQYARITATLKMIPIA